MIPAPHLPQLSPQSKPAPRVPRRRPFGPASRPGMRHASGDPPCPCAAGGRAPQGQPPAVSPRQRGRVAPLFRHHLSFSEKTRASRTGFLNVRVFRSHAVCPCSLVRSSPVTPANTASGPAPRSPWHRPGDTRPFGWRRRSSTPCAARQSCSSQRALRPDSGAGGAQK